MRFQAHAGVLTQLGTTRRPNIVGVKGSTVLFTYYSKESIKNGTAGGVYRGTLRTMVGPTSLMIELNNLMGVLWETFHIDCFAIRNLVVRREDAKSVIGWYPMFKLALYRAVL